MDKHEIIKAKRIAKMQGQLKALRHMEQKINDEVLCVFEKLKKDGVEMHLDNVDSRELGILDGRYECARGLITQIKKWENEE